MTLTPFTLGHEMDASFPISGADCPESAQYPYAALVNGRPMPASDVVVEDLDDDVCLYRPDIDEVLVLNQSAGDVWRLADGEHSVDDIVERLAVAYRLPAHALYSDVERVLVDLAERGYLVDTDPPGTT